MERVKNGEAHAVIFDWIKPSHDRFLIVFLSILCFLPFLGGVHLFDWDEINFAECAREMRVSGDYFRPQIDFQPFFEKPPLFIWLQVASMAIFGENEFAARFPNAVCGVITLLFIFSIGQKKGGRQLGWLWVAAWVASLLPHLYFRSGIIDPWFNLLIFSGLYQYFQKKHLLGGVLIGLAILTKGPVALLIFGLVVALEAVFSFVFSENKKTRNRAFFAQIKFGSLAILVSLAVASTWFLLEFLKNGAGFFERFIKYQIRLFSIPDAGHGGFFGYHFVVLLVGCFPASVFAIRALFQKKATENRWFTTLFWVVLILFSITTTKIVHYSSLCYFPLTFLAAGQVDAFLNQRTKLFFWEKCTLGLLGFLLAFVIILMPFLGKNPEIIQKLIKNDSFAVANLAAEVGWTGWESLVGVALLVGLMVGFFYLQKGKTTLAVCFWLLGSLLFVTFGLLFFIRKIEGYSQRAAIEFYESKSGENCQIRTQGFFSYAPHFYAKQQPNEQNMPDARLYFVLKINKAEAFKIQPEFREIYRKNGFVFFEKIK